MIAAAGMFGTPEELPASPNPLLPSATAAAIMEPLSLGWFLLLPAPLLGLVSLRRQWRAATGAERAQLQLLRRVAAVVVISFGICFATSFAGAEIGGWFAILSLAVFAVAMGVAILEYGLLGLDAFVDRGLTAVTTAALLAGAYVACVVGVNAVLNEPLPLTAALPATVLVAVLLTPVQRLARRTVSRLLHGHSDDPFAVTSSVGARLQEATTPTALLQVLVDAIAAELRLPYVSVRLDPEHGRVSAEHGTLRAPVAAALELVHGGERLGVLEVGARGYGTPLRAADRRILEDVARRTGATVRAIALSFDLQRSQERLVTAREDERGRLRSDLHDGLGPSLAGAALMVEAAQRRIIDDPGEATTLLEHAATAISDAVGEVRRVVDALHPAALDDVDLGRALELEVATWAARGSDGPRVEYSIAKPLPTLSAATAAAAFLIAREALTNVARHADAHHVVLTVEHDAALITLVVQDDGRGIAAAAPMGIGLRSMTARAVEAGGRCTIGPRPGGGTLVRAALPL